MYAENMLYQGIAGYIIVIEIQTVLNASLVVVQSNVGLWCFIYVDMARRQLYRYVVTF